MKILVLNCGSSSVKFRLFETENMQNLVCGIIDRIGSEEAGFVFHIPMNKERRKKISVQNHKQALDIILETICSQKYGIIESIYEIDAIGHRVVHGGETFTQSVLINEVVLQKMKACVRFAPLHNPPNIDGIQASLYLIPFARQVAVFDTAFHQSMESHAFIYALPYEWYENRGIRRYGFHGTSHKYVAHRAARILGKPIQNLKLIICHLGNGSSITAVDGGHSVETSMGFTPLEGLVMGTRCGDIDPTILVYIMEEDDLTPTQIDTVLNKKSGLYGITGGDNDLRAIEDKAEAGSERHRLALKIFTHRIKKYIGAYAAVLGGVDCLIFTAGIGENSSTVRKMCCEGLSFLGIEIDPVENENNEIFINCARTPVLVIPTNEELAIAREVVEVLRKEEKATKIGDRT